MIRLDTRSSKMTVGVAANVFASEGHAVRRIGSRQLKAALGEILREVREHGEEFVVTHRGRPIARLIPEPSTEAGDAEFEAIWAEMERLSDEISQEWPEDISAADAVSEQRREL